MLKKKSFYTVLQGFLSVAFAAVLFIFFNTMTGGSSGLYNDEYPALLLFLTSISLYAVFFMIFNPKCGRVKNEKSPISPVYPLVLFSVITLLTRVLVLYFSKSNEVELFGFSDMIISVVSLPSMFFIYKLCENLWTKRSGYVASLLYALFPVQLFFCKGNILTALAEPLAILTFYLLYKSYEANSSKTSLGYTVSVVFVFCAAVVLETTYLFILPCLLLFYFICGSRKKRTFDNLNVKFYYILNPLTFIILSAILAFVAYFLIFVKGYSEFFSAVSFDGISTSNIFNSIGERSQMIWGGQRNIYNHATQFFLFVLIRFTVIASIIGIINFLKKPNAKFIPLAFIPLFYTTYFMFVSPGIDSYLMCVPFMIIMAAYGISVAFYHLPLENEVVHNNSSDSFGVTFAIAPAVKIPDCNDVNIIYSSNVAPIFKSAPDNIEVNSQPDFTDDSPLDLENSIEINEPFEPELEDVPEIEDVSEIEDVPEAQEKVIETPTKSSDVFDIKDTNFDIDADLELDELISSQGYSSNSEFNLDNAIDLDSDLDKQIEIMEQDLPKEKNSTTSFWSNLQKDAELLYNNEETKN